MLGHVSFPPQSGVGGDASVAMVGQSLRRENFVRNQNDGVAGWARGAEGSDACRKGRIADTNGQSMGRSRGQRYTLPGSEEVPVLYTGSHVICSRAGVRHARLARLGGAAKPEAAAACPRLLNKIKKIIILY